LLTLPFQTLTLQRTHVPFRDSKLTRLLTDSLGGNSKTCLCANIGPATSSYDETYSTLLFAQRAMTVKNIAVVNETMAKKPRSMPQAAMGDGRYRGQAFANGLAPDGSKMLTEEQWNKREQELTAKYTTAIDQLQHEVARQNVSTRLTLHGSATNAHLTLLCVTSYAFVYNAAHTVGHSQA
jgi:hypothetical protein